MFLNLDTILAGFTKLQEQLTAFIQKKKEQNDKKTQKVAMLNKEVVANNDEIEKASRIHNRIGTLLA